MKKLLGIALVGLFATTAIGCGPRRSRDPAPKGCPGDRWDDSPPAGGTATDPRPARRRRRRLRLYT